MLGLPGNATNIDIKKLPPHLYELKIMIDKYVDVRPVVKNKGYKGRSYEVVFK
jgi:hypothetical protein